jgi:hypothetical protein
LRTMELLRPQTDTLVAKVDSTIADTLQADSTSVKPHKFQKIDKQSSASDVELVLPNFFKTEFKYPIIPEARKTDVDGWILPLLMLFFFLIALINLAFPRALIQIATAVFRLDGIRKIQSDENAIMRKAMQLMHLIYIFLFPLFTYQLIEYRQISFEIFSAIPVYWKLLFLSGGMLATKIALVSILGYLFNCVEESTYYRHGILIMNCLLVLVLIPISLLLKISPALWSPYIIAAGLLFFGFFYLLSLAIGVLAGLRSKTLSKFHLILYFCALEAIPVFMILKIAKTFI